MRSTALLWAWRLVTIVALGAALNVSAQSVTPSPKPPALQRPGAAGTDPQGAPKSLAPGAIALELDGSLSPQETERRFKALPDDARVRLKDGRILTKRELVAEFARKREESLARLKKSGGGGSSSFAALKAQHAAKQEAELARARGQVEAQVRQLPADPSDEEQAVALKELEAIRAEARQLRARQASASATEKGQIGARADVLLKRAQKLLGGPPFTMLRAEALTNLCQIVDCTKPVPLCADGPMITGWVPFSGMRQGGVVALGGSCYGQPGTLRLKGLPGGDVMLDVVEWRHKAVAASIPSTLAVPDETTVTVEVTRADGKQATSPPITFSPLRELKKVPRSAVSVNVCGGALTDCNHCNDTTVNLSTSSLNFCQFAVASDATIRGEHAGDCIFGCNHPGTDQYRITLKNHHRFHSATWSKEVSAAGEANADGSQATTAHVQGKASVAISVPFWVTGWDWVRYEIDLYAEGPVNVPGW